MFDNFFGRYQATHAAGRGKVYSLGSGLIIDESGYILTNDHVVRRPTRSRFWWDKCSRSQLVGTSGGRDVALLKIDPPNHVQAHARAIAKDDDVAVGETVIALGNPF